MTIKGKVIVKVKSESMYEVVPVEFHWENNFGQGGFWRPWYGPSARQLWQALKCESLSTNEDYGPPGVDLQILGWAEKPEGFDFHVSPTYEPRVRLVKGFDGGIHYLQYPTWGAIEHPRDLSRDDVGRLPEEEGYGVYEDA